MWISIISRTRHFCIFTFGIYTHFRTTFALSHFRSLHMFTFAISHFITSPLLTFWCLTGADVGQFSPIWSDVAMSHTDHSKIYGIRP